MDKVNELSISHLLEMNLPLKRFWGLFWTLSPNNFERPTNFFLKKVETMLSLANQSHKGIFIPPKIIHLYTFKV